MHRLVHFPRRVCNTKRHLMITFKEAVYFAGIYLNSLYSLSLFTFLLSLFIFTFLLSLSLFKSLQLFVLFIYAIYNHSMWPTPKPPKFPRIIETSEEGMEAFTHAHPLCSHQDILVTHIFSRVRWEDQYKLELTCKKWRLWWRLRTYGSSPYFWLNDRRHIEKWIIDDIIYNNGRDLHAWINKDMTQYFDGFPWLFKED
ncbi:uncharacterized protein LOC125494146 [Beta vulgaris subsp. vulgaris]|uniref:uncharacterized protein LOC125494146 n=1 Tax=Beta vulgaris subsp. vulgaris TaxID=3555 RepID=UPI00053FD065|nr:uncharacterized protein LOC125494146 [Beta vulgaris subsp. vulgaris]